MATDPPRTTPPPCALRRNKKLVHNGHERVDPYYWLRDDKRRDAQVLAHLRAENAYTQSMLAHTVPLQQQLYEELVGRVAQDDDTVPYEKHGDWHYRRFRKGEEHPVYARRRGMLEAPEEIVLDVNRLAEGHVFYEVGNLTISPDGRWLAYVEDPVSRGEWTLKIKDLESGETHDPGVTNVSTCLAWANDSCTLFFIRQQVDTLIPYQVWRMHRDHAGADAMLVLEENDPRFSLALSRSRDDRHIVLTARQTLSTETHLLSASDPAAPPSLVLAREAEHEYWVEPIDDTLWIRSNWHAPNYRLFRTSLREAADRSKWQEIIAHREDVLLDDFIALRRHLVLEERREGLLRVRLLPLNGGDERLIVGDEEAGTVEIDVNPNVDATKLRYAYTSMTTPESIYEHDLATGEEVLLKRTEVPGGFRREDYVTERLYAPSRDGRQIPITLLYRQGLQPDGSHPLWVGGYGAYGIVLDPAFRSSRLPIVDRGFVYALAHVRGGEDLGRRWYDEGRLLQKRNTFTDFIDVTENLIARGWGDPSRVVASGGSAGGLLMGAVINLRPELYRAVIAAVPFVDVVTTMLDESIPLTTFEYDEWGDPRERRYYDYMLSYSPYDNVAPVEYPHLYVSSGLWDPAVQYWEPAKWVAKLRATAVGERRLLLFTDLEAGHRGQAGRFQRLRETAREYAFVLDVLGVEG